MGCCALGTCTDPACYLCTVVAVLPQPSWTKDTQVRHAVPEKKKEKPVKREREQ